MKLAQIKVIKESKPVTVFGKVVKPEDLTADFHWAGKIIPIGKFDPHAYAEHGTTFPAIGWDEIKSDVIAQLECTKEFSDDDIASIDQLDTQHFIDCIVER